jgi:1-acyl-sn-glycerol-3-phosphate acyltransferase
MYKPYIAPVIRASPDVKVREPRISKFYAFLVSILVKPYFYMLFGFAKIILRGDKILFDVFKKVLSGESRCIIAFRHPDGREPQLLSWFFLFRLKKLAAKNKARFPIRPHAIFVYGYEVVRWGGSLARIFMPNMGAIPIHHTKLDSKGMARIYKAITEGPYPVAMAPEGQVSYSTDTLPRLEAGVIRIGFQAVEQMDHKDAEKKLPVEILPVSVHFRYDSSGKMAMEKLLVKTERACGFSRKESRGLSFRDRLEKCRKHILETNEKRYGIEAGASQSVEERLEKMAYASLETAERMLGIKSEGEYFPRLYKVRHDCWDRIFLPGVDNLDGMTGVERSILDLKAGEAWHIARHQELADFSWYFRRPPVSEDAALHLRVEYVQNLWDFANRTMGGAISGRVNLYPRKVIIQTASPINLTDRFKQYKEDKKTAVDTVLAELEKSYLDCIKEVNDDLPD